MKRILATLAILIASLSALPTAAETNKRMASGPLMAGDMDRLGCAAWTNWQWHPRWDNAESADTYIPTLRPKPGSLEMYGERWIRRFAQAHVGATYVILNEPTIPDQDNLTAKRAARFTAKVIHEVTAWDPEARFVVGGFMIHHREHPAYAGCGYDGGNPAGGPDYWNDYYWHLRGRLGEDDMARYVIGYHIHVYYRDYNTTAYDVAWLRQAIGWFRDWMARRGLQDLDLWLTEWGALHYNPDQSRLQAYMRDCLAYLDRTDDVQRYAWYIGRIVSGQPGFVLLDSEGRLTELGRIYQSYRPEMTDQGRDSTWIPRLRL